MGKELHDLRQMFEHHRPQELVMYVIEEQHHEAQLHQPELHQRQHHQRQHRTTDDVLLEPRGGFDHNDHGIYVLNEADGLNEGDEGADARSISAIIPHKLEPGDGEGEEELAAAKYEENEEHERHGPVDELKFGEDSAGVIVGGDEVKEEDYSRADPIIDPERECEDKSD